MINKFILNLFYVFVKKTPMAWAIVSLLIHLRGKIDKLENYAQNLYCQIFKIQKEKTTVLLKMK